MALVSFSLNKVLKVNVQMGANKTLGADNTYSDCSDIVLTLRVGVGGGQTANSHTVEAPAGGPAGWLDKEKY